jgi:hypothetical protein
MSKNRQTLSVKPAEAAIATAVPAVAVGDASLPTEPVIAPTPLETAPTEQATDSAGANQGNTPEAPEAAVTAAPAWKLGDVVEVIAVVGQLQHLHTGTVFGPAPVSIEIDAFAALQLEAGKLAIHSET